MKKLLFVVVSLLTMIALVACNKDSEDKQMKHDTFILIFAYSHSFLVNIHLKIQKTFFASDNQTYGN